MKGNLCINKIFESAQYKKFEVAREFSFSGNFPISLLYKKKRHIPIYLTLCGIPLFLNGACKGKQCFLNQKEKPLKSNLIPLKSKIYAKERLKV